MSDEKELEEYIDGYLRLLDKYNKLKAQLKDANEMADFYADDDNWYECYEPNGGDWHIDGCGERAREYKEKYK